MEVRAPYPDLIDKGEAPPMLHLIDESDYSRFLCGVKRKPTSKVQWVQQSEIGRAIDCVVCAHLGGSK